MEMAQSNLPSRVITTACGMCYVGCGVKVRVDDGVVVNIEGNPDNPQNRGKMCAKGKSAFMTHYNPHRVKTPLRRTNSEKGFGVDPGWVEITWKEAIDTIVSQLERIRDNPKKFWVYAWEVIGDNNFWLPQLGIAFGSPHCGVATSPTCGKAIHPVEFFSGGGFHQAPDLHYSSYCILVGTQFGIASRSAFNHNVLDMAEARSRGMKLVVVDPVGGHAASKADEWIPIRPGTDTALANSMLHVLLNELRIYDEPFLKHRTNAPYLVGPDGLYIRDAATNEPLIHDAGDGKVKTHDDPSLADPSLTGTYEALGQRGRPSFELLREHVAKYPPETTEKITTIPAATVRRITREFGEAARIGETICIDGVDLPFRPVAVDWARGTQGHKHGFHNCWPLKLVNIVVGAVNVPGGILSTGAAGKFPHHWWPESGTDGMLEHGGSIMHGFSHAKAFPGRAPTTPIRMDIGELFPLASHFQTLLPITLENPAAYGLSEADKIEVLLHSPTNPVLGSWGDPRKVENLLKSLHFIFGFAVEINETTLFDDIVLPFPSSLERYDFNCGTAQNNLGPCGQDDFCWSVRQPAVEAAPSMRHPQEVIQEIAERLGILGNLYRLLNHTYGLKSEYALQPGKRYLVTEFIDRAVRSWFGEEHSLDWFREHNVLRHPKGVDEAYINPFLKARIPVYLEHFVTRGKELKAVVGKLGLDWDLSDYQPLSDWRPCPSYRAIEEGEYDLIAVHFKFPYVYGAYGNENPWIDELCEATNAYRILLNSAVGKAKGIANGDTVWLQSPVHKVRATVKLTECIHPEVVGIGGHFGHFSPGMPISLGKGVNFNSLLPTDLEHIDKISTALDHCVQVKVYK
ncbi:MAG: hypothetical protein A3G80_04115 [Betaproteobacteria bacterium RIFCSPLOWO2_12_FULL_62_13b]|nr:MAG: hypothetical protein A3G80_04115 [Betaproteobacteria bacterium RIFCSPLOWO2_12_FULL_62_13b]